MNFKTWWESEERDADWYLPILAESAWNAALASGYTADARLVELLEAAHSELQWWAAQDIEEPACVTATLDRLNDALMLVRSNAKAVGLDAAGGQSHTSDGLCVAVTKEISMPSKVFMICNSYESGYGRGLANDGLDLSKTPHADPEQGEAYQIGYEEGCAAARRGKHLPATIHSAKECSEAFEWLRAEATRDGAPPQAGIALDEWHALTMAATHNDKAQGEAQGSSRLSPGATGSAAGAPEKGKR